MFDELATAVGPDGLLITNEFQILWVYRDVSRYLMLARGAKLQFDISMLIPQLGRDARVGQLHVLEGGEAHTVQLMAYPLKMAAPGEHSVLIAFKRQSMAKPQPTFLDPKLIDDTVAARLETLEDKVNTNVH